MASITSPGSYYSDSFFDSLEEGTLQSARVVVPILLRIIQASSVVDVGCGRGAWLKALQECGVSRIKGIDGEYVSSNRRLIPEDQFSAVDLSKPFRIDEKYDLALCLEVAEHLPFSMGPHLVRQLTAASPFVLFSAAIPGQTGTNHVNEQWPSYWQALFKENGYILLDLIRRHIWHDRRVEWWYRQNIVLYGSEAVVRQSTDLLDQCQIGEQCPLEWVHVKMLNHYGSIRSVCNLLRPMMIAALQRRYKKLIGIKT